MSLEIDGNSSVNKVSTNQEINPVALSKMDKINGKPVQSTLHEVTESYVGGTISKETGVSVGKATPADASNLNSVFRKAHDNVVPQSGNIYEHFYNLNNCLICGGMIIIQNRFYMR